MIYSNIVLGDCTTVAYIEALSKYQTGVCPIGYTCITMVIYVTEGKVLNMGRDPGSEERVRGAEGFESFTNCVKVFFLIFGEK